MQNIVNQYIRNGLKFLYPQRVTRFCIGNNPANVLVTEIPQYFTIFCFLAKWQNGAIRLICNRLRFTYAVSLIAVLLMITHAGRHTFASLITLSEGVPIETVSRMLGHRDIKTTQIYAELSLDKIAQDIQSLAARIEGKYLLID